MSELRGNTALDSSALIEYLTASPLGSILKEYFESLTLDETVGISILSVAETFYVLCRKHGQKFASERMAEILSSRVIDILNSVELAIETGKLKCKMAISVADCSCLATAKLAKAKAIFAFRENELLREIKRGSLDDAGIVFLEDMVPDSRN